MVADPGTVDRRFLVAMKVSRVKNLLPSTPGMKADFSRMGADEMSSGWMTSGPGRYCREFRNIPGEGGFSGPARVGDDEAFRYGSFSLHGGSPSRMRVAFPAPSSVCPIGSIAPRTFIPDVFPGYRCPAVRSRPVGRLEVGQR